MRRGSRILMVLDHSFPPDIRVENEARSLLDAGFKVAVLAIGPDDRPVREWMDGLEIIRDRLPGRLRNWLRGLTGTVGLPSRILASRILKAERAWSCDALHIHDLYLFGAGIRAGRHLGIPVVGDLHENWVEALRHYAWSTTFPAKLVVSFPRWEKLEARWVNQVDRLIVVVSEAAARNEALGVPTRRIVEVPNTVRVADFDAHPVKRDIVESAAGRFTVVYTGGMDIHRGLDGAIRSMLTVREVLPDARLLLVGDGRIREDLEALVRSLNLEGSVTFAGWQPQEDIPSWIAAADVCLVPHRRTVHTDATLPHKLFHYMHAARPVVVSDCLPLKRIVMAEQCGLVVPDGDPDGMGRAILRIARDPAEAAAMGARGRHAVAERWNWTSTSGDLVTMYRELLAQESASAR